MPRETSLDSTTAATTYDFRAPRPGESETAYRTALIEHVEHLDITASHELRVGRRQAEWTRADIDAFVTHAQGLTGPASVFAPGLHVIQTWDDEGPYAITNASLLTQARKGMNAFIRLRRDQPTAPLPVMVSVLLTTGHVQHAIVDAHERLAYLKATAHSQPVFGFLLIFDGWIHHVSKGKTPTASKRDAIVVNVGSRDGLRCTMVRPYEVSKGRVHFDNPAPADLTQTDLRSGTDPYADIFAVPTADRVQ